MIRWVRFGLDDLLGNAEDNAQVVLGWLSTGFPGIADQQLDSIGTIADGYFSGLKSTVAGWLDDIGSEVTGNTLTDLLATPSPTTSSSSQVSVTSSSGINLTSMLTDVRHNWLVDKIEDAVNKNPPNFTTSSALGGDLTNLVGDFSSWGGETQLQSMVTTMWDQLDQNNAISQAADFKDLLVAVMLAGINEALDDLLGLADGVVDHLLQLMKDVLGDIADTLTTSTPGGQLVVDVLSKLGVHADLSFGHIGTLGVMVPTTFVYQLVTQDGSQLFPASAYTATTNASRTANAAAAPVIPDFTLALKYIHADARLVLAATQTLTDINSIASSNGISLLNKWDGLFTPILSLVIAACTYPGTKNTDGSTPAPFTTPPSPRRPPAGPCRR